MPNVKLINAQLIYSEEFIASTKVHAADGKDVILPARYIQVLYKPDGTKVASIDPATGKIYCNIQAIIDPKYQGDHAE